jgi:hypothetical protein
MSKTLATLLGLASSLVVTQAHAEDYPKPAQLCDKVIGNNTKMRYCRNRALSSETAAVKRAVIVIPGSESPAKDFYDKVLKIGEEEGVLGSTNIIVPQFLEDDGEGQTVLQKLGLTNDYAFWSGGWRQGNSAKNGDGVSSFEMVDFIVRRLIEHNSNLEHIAVVGHSAGGQFVNRYAAGTNIVSFAATARPNKPVSMSFGVSSAGSFVFLNEDRPVSPANCSDYNRYKYGLDDLNSYMNDSTDDQIIWRSLTRHVRYFVGALDTGADTGCQVTVQGLNHVVRMRNYMNHLNDVCVEQYGSATCDTSRFQDGKAFWEIANVGHDSTKLFRSDVGRKILFHWK